MVIKVKQNSMRISSSLPEDNQNSDSPYHFTAKRLMILFRSDIRSNTEHGVGLTHKAQYKLHRQPPGEYHLSRTSTPSSRH
jgi:hypothetical protein